MTSNTPHPVRDVLIVGAGFAGLYAVHAFRRAGLDVVCLEAGSDVGGTWYFNRYPGARCDVESVDYSYSFDEDLQNEWVWSERYATQPEILAYIHHVADRFDLRRHVLLERRVTAARFDEHASRWTVRTAGGEEHRARYLLFATGSLSAPNRPDIPGADEFAGDTYFTARWPEPGPSLAGKRVGVIGTGSSAIQSVPILAREADSLTVFQRTANYSVPALNRPLTDEDQRRIRAEYPARRAKARASGGGSPHESYPKRAVECTPEEREAALEAGWRNGGVLFGKTFPDQFTDITANDYAREFAERKIREIVRDPVTARDLIPTDHPIGTKRICTDSGYFETFNKDTVALVNLRREPITRITPRGVETTAALYELDVLVYATGFDAMTGALTRIDITGARGRSITEAWADGPVTYLGVQIPGFPNLFTVNGPGAPSVLSNMVLTAEQQVDWLVGLLQHADGAGATQVEVRDDAAVKWTDHVQQAADATLFPRANSWYLGANIPGKPRRFMPYVAGLGAYRQRCEEVREDGYEGFVFTTR
ncbi:flavin-containing monooxygenase [Amycolatopsis viridis]|uniref:Cation diffusion facilitator CzcD-associated flavoprotein CzcO n=1 Tax=Amycolatopsis viridis TaxID=185678 RepID=A0ABX0SZT0_9PSEU|nr:NAD(P)/FAD-dependent oxidoreductase [Amycolatopsis viridis]NIH80811.1 cation diffusion facilitator CzcD-associated flavoprotein CzcO [Amycolatopsis viridis]